MIVKVEVKNGKIKGYYGLFTAKEREFIDEAFRVKYMFIRNPKEGDLNLDVPRLNKSKRSWR